MVIKITLINDDGLELSLQMGKSYNITTFEKTYDREIRRFYRDATLTGVENSILRFYCSDSREPYAGTLEDRINSLKKAKEMGIETWVSLEPVIFPEQALEVIDLTKDYTDHYKIGKVSNFYTGNHPDWRAFTLSAIEAIEKAGKTYYIKKSLQPYI